MGQPDARRLQFNAIQALTSAANDDRQTLTQTAYIKVGDVLEFWDGDSALCLRTFIGTRTVTAVNPDNSIYLDSAIDLTVVTDTALIRNRTIDDVKEALDRLFLQGFEADDYLIQWNPSITACEVDTPVVGQSTQSVADASCFYPGDSWALVSDEGLAGTGTVVASDFTLNKVTIDDSIDCGALTNPVLINTSVDLKTQLLRIKQALDEVGTPIQEALDDGDCDNTAFEVSQKFIQDSSNLYLDGVRKRKGTAGTRAALTNGAGNAQLLLTSLVLGLDGNDIDFEMLDPGAPSSALSVTVTGTYDAADRKISVSLETDGGSALISTAEEVADAINAHASAKRLVLVRFGGDGSGVQAALAATPLAGGLNNGTGDYAELEQVFNNLITATGYRWVSLHIRPNEPNRLSSPPRESEELDIAYSQAV